MSVGVTLYETEISVLLSLEEEKRGRILSAILCDTMGQPLPEMDASEKAIFTLVNAQVKRAADLSAKRRENAKSRWNSQVNNCKTNTDERDLYKDENTNSMQICTNECNVDTNECTNTSTNTSTNTGDKSALAHKTKKSIPEKIKYADFVSLTSQEHDTLIAELGEDVAKWCINKLNNYKGSTGKKYKSDYLTIRGWVIESYYEEQRKRNQQYGNKPPGENSEQTHSRNPFINAVIGNDGNGG